mmetsp:Transcript_71553/g.186060  ORF Transcript_71553/g.186060 Transcript_71553/m.186060 type:complete len:657 (-) Transcript_71553:97-2067(-)
MDSLREKTEELLPGIGDSDPHWTASIFAVWNLIIRPPRTRYSRLELLQDFPAARFRLLDQLAHRRHFHVTNPRGIPLACTVFEPIVPVSLGAEQERACIVYCHGNGSCRLAGFRLARVFLPLGIALCCFDFAGSGMSGGEYVSLGYYERDDLGSVIDHLRNELGFARIGLWGYSMGAVTTLMHAARDPSLAGVVADSPFCDLWTLIKEVCFHFVRLPSLLVAPVLQVIRLVIQQKAGFDICDVSPQAHVGNSFVPALFLHGEQDVFVTPAHSERLRQAYCGEAQRLTMPNASHASNRADKFIARAAVFLVRALRWESFLPTGSGERAFAELEAGRLLGRVGGAQRRDEIPAMPAEVATRITRFLQSKEPQNICSGLLQAALSICPPYRGAEFLSSGFSSSVGASPSPCGRRRSIHRTTSCPARFMGQVTFPDHQAELGLCWVRSAHASADGGGVECALLSTSVASLTSVALARRAGGAGRAVSAGDLQCTSVEPKDVGTLSLEVGRPYDIVLIVGSSGVVELQVDGRTVACASATALPCQVGAASSSSVQELHLWIVQWKQNAAGGDVDDDAIGVQLHLDSAPAEQEPDVATFSLGPRRRPISIADEATPAEPPLEERMAETLATLCFGRPVLSSASRAHLRSGIYFEDGAVDCSI